MLLAWRGEDSMTSTEQKAIQAMQHQQVVVEGHLEPLKLLVPSWVEREALHSGLLGVTIEVELDVGV